MAANRTIRIRSHNLAWPVIDATSGPWTAELNGIWRWHKGDNLQWASPSFDDSNWSTFKVPGPLPNTSGSYWIRLHLNMGASADPGLLLGPIAPAYEVYWDGRRIGQFGRLTPKVVWFLPRLKVFHVPFNFAGRGGHIVSIRAWEASRVGLGFPWVPSSAGSRAGDFAALRETEKSLNSDIFRRELLNFVLTVVIALAGLYFVFIPPSIAQGNVFRWFALFLLARALQRLFDYNDEWGPLSLSYVFSAGLRIALLALNYFIWFEFAYLIFYRRTPMAVRAMQALLILVTLLYLADPVSNRWIYFAGSYFLLLIATTLALSIGYIEWRRRSPGAGVALGIFVLSAAASIHVLRNFFLTGSTRVVLNVYGSRVRIWDLVVFLWIPGIAYQIQRMNQRFRDEQQRLNGEMQAARRVQEILLPSKTVRVPGFEIDSVYQPAAEVGGDFFQLFPAADNSLLVVVGDVSGKGMKAALLVSLIVGALQNRKSDQPASILSELNSALLGRSEGGFTTCCCALFAPDGTLTLANAGHLAPYRNGKEIETAPGLPLGVIGAASWDETQIALEPGDRIVWMSDGIVEARNGKRDLLGFTRAQELAVRSVSEIARSAQEFGQEDDITVISITRQPVPAYVA